MFPILPKIKKKISSFLMDEKGTISKKNLIKGAIFLSGLGFAIKNANAVTNPAPKKNTKFKHENCLLMTAYPLKANPGSQWASADIIGRNFCELGSTETSQQYQEQIVGNTFFAPTSEKVKLPGVQNWAKKSPWMYCVPFQTFKQDQNGKITEAITRTECRDIRKYYKPDYRWYNIIHKSGSRSFHNNNLNLTYEPGQKTLIGKHSHHGQHFNANSIGNFTKADWNNYYKDKNTIEEDCTHNIKFK